jgi:cell wall-associated NlpC family hydrolase
MKRIILVALAILMLTLSTSAQSIDSPTAANAGSAVFWEGVKSAIQSHLGRPYVWGAAGLKSFDCSGFVWRVMADNGILIKRTTARKFYQTLPRATRAEQSEFGTLVFFDDLKHVGIIDGPAAFYHSESSIGTNRSAMTPFWRNKIFGFRKIPVPTRQ